MSKPLVNTRVECRVSIQIEKPGRPDRRLTLIMDHCLARRLLGADAMVDVSGTLPQGLFVAPSVMGVLGRTRDGANRTYALSAYPTSMGQRYRLQLPERFLDGLTGLTRALPLPGVWRSDRVLQMDPLPTLPPVGGQAAGAPLRRRRRKPNGRLTPDLMLRAWQLADDPGLKNDILSGMIASPEAALMLAAQVDDRKARDALIRSIIDTPARDGGRR